MNHFTDSKDLRQIFTPYKNLDIIVSSNTDQKNDLGSNLSRIFMDKRKAEEVIPEMIKALSKGHAVSITSFAEHFEVVKTTLKRRFKEVVDAYYSEYIFYDERDKCWFAYRTNFLELVFIQPEEAVILNGILRNSSHYGPNLSSRVHMMVNGYLKRGRLAYLQPETIESIEHIEKQFIALENAIKHRRKVTLSYMKNDELKTKRFFPVRIVNMEYYWYVVGEIEEEFREIRYFRIKKIANVEFLDEYADYSAFRKLYNEVKNVDAGMNAFYQPYKKINKVKVLIPEWFEDYVKDVPYFKTWDNTKKSEVISNESYIIYELSSTDEQYMDVIPAIQKYMPHIVVCNTKENQELIRIMKERSEKYAAVFNSYKEE